MTTRRYLRMCLIGCGIVAAVVVVCIILGGCGGKFRIPGLGSDPPSVPLETPSAVNFAILGWLAAACMVVGVGSLIVSFVVPLVPRKMSASVIAVGVGCWALQYFLSEYLRTAVLLAFIVAAVAGAAMLAPFIIAWVRARLLRTSNHLANGQKDPRAAAALRIAATPERFKGRHAREKRKALLASIEGGSSSTRLGPVPTAIPERP